MHRSEAPAKSQPGSYRKENRGFPGGSGVKNPPANAGDGGLISGSRRSPGEGNGNPLHYSCLGKPMDRGAGGLQSVGLQRVGHDLATKQQQLQLPKACDISFSNHMYQCESLMCT